MQEVMKFLKSIILKKKKIKNNSKMNSNKAINFHPLSKDEMLTHIVGLDHSLEFLKFEGNEINSFYEKLNSKYKDNYNSK